jgi:hypothetical protein
MSAPLGRHETTVDERNRAVVHEQRREQPVTHAAFGRRLDERVVAGQERAFDANVSVFVVGAVHARPLRRCVDGRCVHA